MDWGKNVIAENYWGNAMYTVWNAEKCVLLQWTDYLQNLHTEIFNDFMPHNKKQFENW